MVNRTPSESKFKLNLKVYVVIHAGNGMALAGSLLRPKQELNEMRVWPAALMLSDSDDHGDSAPPTHNQHLL
jgi:hypothetical protein